MKLRTTAAALASLMFLASCGSDPEIDAVVENLVADGFSESDAKCYAKEVKKTVNDEQWVLFQEEFGLTSVVEGKDETMEDILESAGDALAMMPMIMAATMKCGISMDL